MRPLVVAGMGRSGTTILQQLCDGHPQMQVTAEFGNYAFLGDHFLRYSARALARIHEIGGGWRILGPTEYVPSRFSLQIRLRGRNHAANIRHVAVHLFQLARRRTNRVTLSDLVESVGCDDKALRIIGDKRPTYAFMLDRLVTLPSLLRLVIYRDCRDLTSSYLMKVRTDWRHERWTRFVNTAEKIARRWVHAMEQMENHREYLYLMRYEDLVADPLRELNRLAEWLGVDPSGFDTGIVFRSSVGKHKRGLTARELEDVLRVAGPTMERLSYRID